MKEIRFICTFKIYERTYIKLLLNIYKYIYIYNIKLFIKKLGYV